MSVGRTCMFTVRPATFAPWCGDPGVAERDVPPQVVEVNGRREVRAGYKETLCARHAAECGIPVPDGVTVAP